MDPTTLTSSDETSAMVHRYFQLLSERNTAALPDLFNKQIDWFIPGARSLAPWLGRRNRPEEVKVFFDMLWENVEPVKFSLDQILVNGSDAVVTGEFTSRMLATGKLYESMFCAQFTVKNCKITRYRLLEDTLALVQALT